MSESGTSRPAPLESVTGVQLAQGLGVQPARGFWSEVWSQVLRRRGAQFGLAWVGVVAFFAVFSPLLASGHPLVMRTVDAESGGTVVSSPLLRNLTMADFGLLLGVLAGGVFLALPLKMKRSTRGLMVFWGAIQLVVIVVAASAFARAAQQRDVSPWMGRLREWPHFASVLPPAIAAVLSLPFLFIPSSARWRGRAALAATVALLGAASAMWGWKDPSRLWDYRAREARGEAQCTYTLVPFSPAQRSTQYYTARPGTRLYLPLIVLVDREARNSLGRTAVSIDEVRAVTLEDPLTTVVRRIIASGGDMLPRTGEDLAREFDEGVASGKLSKVGDVFDWLDAMPATGFVLGTDTQGQDVLSQMMHACRLSISIGLVSTSIAVMIGVTIGALMGYYGGKVDLLLYRVVEIFMAIPVLFLLIVAAAVLPKSTYVMMGIIGCVTWTGAARFTRAEFLKLRSQDFVQSARAAGLPLKSILFRHMLPNGVTPVLVDSSFAIAAAILAEATLSYLGLGPENQASWGRLLSGSKSDAADFVWWLALFPGLAIFLTVLAYNLVGEALRDAIDPKLKKARV